MFPGRSQSSTRERTTIRASKVDRTSIADEVVEAGGEAWTWRGQHGSKDQEQALRERMTAAVVEEYRALLARVNGAQDEPSRRTVERLRRELRKIEVRDHFAPKEREQARRAIDRLVTMVYATEEQALR